MENINYLSKISAKTKLFFNLSLVFFLICLVLFNYYYDIDNQYIVQIDLSILLFVFFNVGLKRNLNRSVILFLIALFQIIAIVLIFLYDIADTPPDSNFYRLNGFLYTMHNWDSLFNSIDKADWGYVSFVGFFYDVFGTKIGEILIVIVKIILHIWTCKLIYDLVSQFYNKNYGIIVTLLWGLNLGATYWITSFLKENLFCFVVTFAVYYLYKYRSVNWERKKIFYLISFFVLVLYTALFREMFPVFFCITFILFSFFSKVVNNNFGVICITAILASYFAMEYIVYFIPNAAGGFIQREELYGNNIIMSILNILNPLISPYPALDLNNNQIANIQVSASSSYNIFFAYFSIMGLYHVIKNKMFKYYPMIMILLLNSVMLISFGFSMNYRFTYVTTPIAYMFIPYGIDYYCKYKLIIPYILFIIALTIIYNIR